MIIVFGTRGLTKQVDSGNFFCPGCWSESRYAHQAVKRWFTLYFIPVLPMGSAGEYIECRKCAGTFQVDVRDFNPVQHEREQEAVEAEFRKVMRATMAMMALADGVIEPEEIEMMRGIYSALTGTNMTAEQAEGVIEKARASNLSIVPYLKKATVDLNQEGRELVLRAAMQIAASDGDFAAEERVLLMDIGRALELKGAVIKRTINDELHALQAS